MESGEMKLRDGVRASLVGAEVFFAVGIVFTETGPQQDDRSVGDAPVYSFPVLQVSHRYLVVGIVRGLLCNVHHDGWSHQLVQRNLVYSMPSLREVDWRVEV